MARKTQQKLKRVKTVHTSNLKKSRRKEASSRAKASNSTVHYLQEKSPRIQQRTVGMENFLHSLGERLNQIESQFGKTVQDLGAQLHGKGSSPHPLETKLQEQLKEIKKEFGNQIHELAQTLDQALPDNLSLKTEKSNQSLVQRLFHWRPSLPHWLSSDGAKESFEKLIHEEIDPFGRDPEFEEFVKPLFSFLYYKYWRISTHGLENIPTKGRALLVGNHSGTLAYDGSMIRVAVSNEHPSGRDVRFLVEDFVYYLPFIGTFMYRVGGVRASRENAERLLNSDHLVAVFPEGVKGIGKYYSQRYHLQRFGRGGFIKLAIRTKSPIIPVAVIGAEEIHPILYKSSLLAKPLGIPYLPITPTLPWLGPLGFLPLPSKWSIYFGEPIDLSHYKESTLKDELQIHKLSEMVRGKIQDMVTEGLKKRRSVWFG